MKRGSAPALHAHPPSAYMLCHCKTDEIPLIKLQPDLVTFGLWLPLILSGLFFSLSLAIYIRIGEMARSLSVLEQVLGNTQLGWEKEFRKHSPTLGPIYFYGWVVLLVSDWIGAILLTR